jgi:hypothetical protein
VVPWAPVGARLRESCYQTVATPVRLSARRSPVITRRSPLDRHLSAEIGATATRASSARRHCPPPPMAELRSAPSTLGAGSCRSAFAASRPR